MNWKIRSKIVLDTEAGRGGREIEARVAQTLRKTYRARLRDRYNRTAAYLHPQGVRAGLRRFAAVVVIVGTQPWGVSAQERLTRWRPAYSPILFLLLFSKRNVQSRAKLCAQGLIPCGIGRS